MRGRFYKEKEKNWLRNMELNTLKPQLKMAKISQMHSDVLQNKLYKVWIKILLKGMVLVFMETTRNKKKKGAVEIYLKNLFFLYFYINKKKITKIIFYFLFCFVFYFFVVLFVYFFPSFQFNYTLTHKQVITLFSLLLSLCCSSSVYYLLLLLFLISAGTFKSYYKTFSCFKIPVN